MKNYSKKWFACVNNNIMILYWMQVMKQCLPIQVNKICPSTVVTVVTVNACNDIQNSTEMGQLQR